ncbi:MAG TPA: DUF222 domain-containing protein [Mycobacteriales bacterium]|jgi:hypothetical protein|nr:DUF222 domain-containing protein [Mycobacteriales bacterium]
MSSTTVSPPDAVTAALGLIDAAACLLLSADVWQLPGQVQADALAAVERVSRRLEYGKLRLLADFHRRDVAGEVAGVSTRQFLKARLRLSSAEALRRLHAVRELVPSVSPTGEVVEPELPATAAVVASGDISSEHAQVISSAISHLPTGLDVSVVAGAEKALAGHARKLDPADLRTVAQRLHLHLNPDGTLPDDKPSRRELTFRRDAYGMDVIRGRLDAEGSATVQAALAPLMQPRRAEDGVRDPRSPARRCADALVELSEQSLNCGDLPTIAGERPHVTVTIGLDDLREGTGHATLNTGAPISTETARRIACDASVIPIVLGGEGEPLDVGRASRTIPPGIRRAVVARDIGCVHLDCVHLDCDQPAQRCEVHHVRHWANGGATALNNLVLLCRHHHWTIHHQNWQIAFQKWVPYIIPPPLIDPEQRPRRNTMHDLPSG